MTENAPRSTGQDEMRGWLTIPTETEPRQATILIDRKSNAASVRFDEPVAGSAVWESTSLSVVELPKYTEIVFVTTGFPKDTVEIIWKLNASVDDETVACVAVVRPNDLRISGEKGFTLVRSDQTSTA